ncbi:MAG: SPOR domain-containing protein, partial [Sulfurimicrobium sp.]
PIAAVPVAPVARQAVASKETASSPQQQVYEADVVAQRLAATENWLATQGPATSSIQLMVSNDLRQLRNHLKKISHWIEMEQIFVYRSKAGGQPAWTVLYGSFPSREKTAEAMDALPESLKVYRPYLRTVQGIRAEIRRNQ